MYTYEERLRAEELHIKLGKRIRATIRQLGYPTKNSLRNWYQEFLERGDLPGAYARSKQKYSVEQKNVAIEHYMDHGRCFSATLKALGYPGRGTLTEWVHERYPETRKCVVGKVGRPAASLESKRTAVYDDASVRLLAGRSGDGPTKSWPASPSRQKTKRHRSFDLRHSPNVSTTCFLSTICPLNLVNTKLSISSCSV